MATVYKRGGKNNRGGRYYISYFDHQGQRVSRSARTTDKATAERIAAKLEADAALRRDGVIDPALDTQKVEAQRSISAHWADFEAKMRVSGRDAKHIAATLGYIRAACAATEVAFISDLTADKVHYYVRSLSERGKSARTIHAVLTALKSFTRWLALHHKVLRDPLATIRKPDPKTDRRRERRMLLPDEWKWLRGTTNIGQSRFRMCGAQRVLLYATAIQTGLRSNELRSLAVRQLYLDASPPFLTCQARCTKNKKPARQYVTGELASELRAWVAKKNSWEPVFSMPDPSDVAAMLKADLADARQAWLDAVSDPGDRRIREQADFLNVRNHAGQQLDFHALRHTCGAWLALAGNHPKVIQAVLRHSSITLTMDTYGHLFPGQEADAIAKLPRLFG